jgi:organic radical activating enzyme
MDENTVVGKLVTGGDPQMLSREIIEALAESEKFGYDVVFEETIEPDDRLTITFSCSGKQQVLVFPGWVWRDRGRVRQTVIDQLTI